MKMKSMLQLLAPIAIAILWYIAWLILGLIIELLAEFKIIFEYYNYEICYKAPFGNDYTILFYTIAVILIIIAEVYITNIPNDEFDS